MQTKKKSMEPLESQLDRMILRTMVGFNIRMVLFCLDRSSEFQLIKLKIRSECTLGFFFFFNIWNQMIYTKKIKIK